LLVDNGGRGFVLIEREFIELEISLSDESSETSILGNSVNSE
jgi:hypothetical protein